MNRRRFLGLLGLGAAAAASTAVLDPEALLWVPGRRKIFDLGGIKRPLSYGELHRQYVSGRMSDCAEWYWEPVPMVCQKGIDVSFGYSDLLLDYPEAWKKATATFAKQLAEDIDARFAGRFISLPQRPIPNTVTL